MKTVIEILEFRLELDDHPFSFKAFRNDLEYRDVEGDGLILAMFDRIVELEEKLYNADLTGNW
jgi:hypothetical protein